MPFALEKPQKNLLDKTFSKDYKEIDEPRYATLLLHT
jgi:hypothetical protein